MTLAKQSKKSRQEDCKKELLGMLKHGDKIYTVLRSVSRSGMSRRMDVYFFNSSCEKYFLTSKVADLLEYSYTTENWRKSAGMRVDGCGMDMGYHVVESLSYALFGNGNVLKQEWL